MKTLFLKPRVSEKSYALSDKSVYVFVVPKNVNKHTIATSVSEQFNVTVENVKTLNVVPKAKRFIKNRGRKVEHGVRASFKKAYVTVKEGDKIQIFAADEDKTAKKPSEKKGKK